MQTEYLPDSAQLVANGLLERNGLLCDQWSYDYGVVWRGMEKLLSIRQDGVWLQVLDCPGRTGNYAESSGSCLIAYALLKGARLGLLPAAFGQEAQRSFVQIQRHFLGRMKNGRYFVAKCCQGAGLGGASGRDGSFDYYISENVISYDLKATGAYLQAACEEQLLREGKCAYDGQSIGLSV